MSQDDRTSLVYYRRVGESIEIGGVTVTVLKTGPSRSRLQIRAPRDVRVIRSETASPQEPHDD